jgi:hypothetical protein
MLPYFTHAAAPMPSSDKPTALQGGGQQAVDVLRSGLALPCEGLDRSRWGATALQLYMQHRHALTTCCLFAGCTWRYLRFMRATMTG